MRVILGVFLGFPHTAKSKIAVWADPIPNTGGFNHSMLPGSAMARSNTQKREPATLV